MEDKLGDRTIDSFVSPLQNKGQFPRRTENNNAVNSNGVFYTQSPQPSLGNNAIDEEQKYLDDENKRLMEIVAQVKADLRQAAASSPTTSVFSPWFLFLI